MTRLVSLILVIAGGALTILGALRPESMEVNFLWYAKDRLVQVAMIVLGLALLGFGGAFWSLGERWWRSKRFRSALGNLIMAGISFTFVVVLAEVGLAVLDQPDPLWTRADETLHHVQIPGIETRFRTAEWDTAVHVNAAGMRDDELRPKAEGRLRLLALGDSFTWGFGVEVEETWVERLESALRSELGDLEILNGGVPSYSPMLEYLYLENGGLDLSPDVVILAFDMSDFQDDLIYEQYASRDDEGNLVAVFGEVSQSPRKGFFKSLRLLRLMRSALDQLYARFGSGREFTRPQHLDLHYNRFALTRDDVPEELAEEHWQRTLGYLDQVHRLLSEHGIPMVLVTYPYGHEASTAEWAEGRHHYGFGAEVVYGDHPARRLESFAAERGIFFVSLFPAFREASNGQLYFAGDGHFNVAGHELAAEALTEALLPYLRERSEPADEAAE